MRKDQGYKCRVNNDCNVNKNYRNRCQYCRLQKCLAMGMRSDTPRVGQNASWNKDQNKNNGVKQVTTPPQPARKPSIEATVLQDLVVEDEELDRENDNHIDYDKAVVTEAIGAMTRAILDLPDDVVEAVRDVPDEVVTEVSLEFNIQMSERPEFFNVYYVCEAASRVRFELDATEFALLKAVAIFGADQLSSSS